MRCEVLVRIGVLVTSSALAACGGTTQQDGADTTDGTSSGGTSSGGTSSGGTSGGSASSGSASSGGALAGTGGDCVARSITFSVRPAAGSADEWCVGLPDCSNVVTLLDPFGEELTLRSFCGVACESCEPELCPPLVCGPPHLVEPGSNELVWDGTHVVVDTCGAAASQCNRSTCALPGRYTAVVCAVPNLATDPAPESCANLESTPPICVEQPFEVGDATAVTITLPAQE